MGAPFAVLKKADEDMFEVKVGDPVLQKTAVLEYRGSLGESPPTGDETVLVGDFHRWLLHCFSFFSNCRDPSISPVGGGKGWKKAKGQGLLTHWA